MPGAWLANRSILGTSGACGGGGSARRERLAFVSIDISSEFRYGGQLIQTGDALVDQRIQRQNGWLYPLCAGSLRLLSDQVGRPSMGYAVVRNYPTAYPPKRRRLRPDLGPTAAEHISAWLDHDEPIDADTSPVAFTTATSGLGRRSIDGRAGFGSLSNADCIWR